MLEDDKKRLGLASGGNDSSILDERLQACLLYTSPSPRD